MTMLSKGARAALNILLDLSERGHLERLQLKLGGNDPLVSATYKGRTFSARNGDSTDDDVDDDAEHDNDIDAAMVRVLNDVIDAAKVTIGDANSVLRIARVKQP